MSTGHQSVAGRPPAWVVIWAGHHYKQSQVNSALSQHMQDEVAMKNILAMELQTKKPATN
jgi:hypothetical protein